MEDVMRLPRWIFPAVLVLACGGLENPDLSSGEIAGRLAPTYPGAHAYVLGRPDLRATLGADGSFVLRSVPVGATQVVLLDGAANAGLLAADVRGAEVAWVGPLDPAPAQTGSVAPQAGSPPAAASPLPLAGGIAATATAGGVPLASARFTVEGTELLDVAPDAGGTATLAPLPPGSFTLLVRADGLATARLAVEVRAGEVAPVGVPLSP
jgi:hypothetical protein